MKFDDRELLDVAPLQELSGMVPPTTGTVDDEDDPADEHSAENEAPIRETSEATEAPEEFDIEDENDLSHPPDNHLDSIDDIEDDA